jgi:hypothetical protein
LIRRLRGVTKTCDVDHGLPFDFVAKWACWIVSCRPHKEDDMPTSLAVLLGAWGAVTVVMTVMVIYGNTLDAHEDEEIYINEKEEKMMGADQKALVARMDWLKKAIFSLAFVSAILLVTSATVWVYVGLARG